MGGTSSILNGETLKRSLSGSFRSIHHEEEKQALIDFYTLTKGNKWKNKKNWCSKKHVKNWAGVTIGIDDRVSKLLLYNMNIAGPISPKLESLEHLTTLYLSCNKLCGTIPEDLYSCTTLVWLDLSDNELTGPLSDSIGRLTNLQKLSLFKNKLDGNIPHSIGHLTNLVQLNLACNKFFGVIPGSIGNLHKLEEFFLADNPLFAPVPGNPGQIFDIHQIFLGSKDPNNDDISTSNVSINHNNLNNYYNNICSHPYFNFLKNEYHKITLLHLTNVEHADDKLTEALTLCYKDMLMIRD